MRKDIVFILDRSGSMFSIKGDTIGGFNQFVDEQKGVSGDVRMSLVQFDDEYEVVFEDVGIKKVKDLNGTTYEPRGMTALLGAIGKTVTDRKAAYKKLKKKYRPGKVAVVILTDGIENASNHAEWSRPFADVQKIHDLVTQQRDKGWEFIFLGANMDAIATATSFGMSAGAAGNFAPTGAGVRSAYAASGSLTTSYLDDSTTVQQ